MKRTKPRSEREHTAERVKRETYPGFQISSGSWFLLEIPEMTLRTGKVIRTNRTTLVLMSPTRLSVLDNRITDEMRSVYVSFQACRRKQQRWTRCILGLFDAIPWNGTWERPAIVNSDNFQKYSVIHWILLIHQHRHGQKVSVEFTVTYRPTE